MNIVFFQYVTATNMSLFLFFYLCTSSSGMLRNLIRKGKANNIGKIQVYNRTKDKVLDLLNELDSSSTTTSSTLLRAAEEDIEITVVNSASEAADGSDITMVCLSDEKACRDILLGGGSGGGGGGAGGGGGGGSGSGEEDGILRFGGIVIDHSTVSPQLTLECSKIANEHHGIFLDAPISGGPEGAANGTLSIMVGGDELSYVRSQQVLQCMGTHGKIFFYFFFF